MVLPAHHAASDGKVVRECIDQATRERRRVANLRVLPVEGPAAPDDLLTLADRDQLERGFRRLPPEQRAILVLRHYEGYHPSEIAEILRIPPGTARSRLHHAHRAMRAVVRYATDLHWPFDGWGIAAGERRRVIPVDAPDGRVVLIEIDTNTAPPFEEFVAAAMLIVESITFAD